MKKIIYILIILGVSGLLYTCGSDDDTPIPDCPEADFRMEIAIADTLLPVDTIFNYNNKVQFTASDLYEAYEWKVGSDTRTWTDQSFSLYFSDAIGNIKITFIGQRKVIEGCELANSTEVITDTIVKNLHVKHLPDPFDYPALEPYLFEGTWRGAFEDTPNDVFEVRIIDFGPGYSGKKGVKSFNFPENCTDYEINEESEYWYSPTLGPYTYKHFEIDIHRSVDFIGCSSSWYYTFGSVYGAKNDSLMIRGFTEESIEKIFRAKKTN